MSVLEVDGLTVKHGGIVALDDVTLALDDGQIVGLIGPNGAGKTTFIDTLTGFTPPAGGRITFDGRDITGASAHDRSRAGLVRTFPVARALRRSLRGGQPPGRRPRPSLWNTLTDALWPKVHDDAETHAVLELLDLVPVADRRPAELSNGQRHMVALGRALVASPRLVLLDEPAAGLDPAETAELAATLRRLSELGTTVLVVDHDMALIMNVCHTVHVLDFGSVVASGPPAQVRRDPTVIPAYLGRQPLRDEERP